MSAQSITQKNASGGAKAAVVAGLIFAGFGLIFVMIFMVGPALNVIRAQSWVRTPCTILSSELKIHPGDDGATFSVDFRYEYTFNNRHYIGDRYHFMGRSSSGQFDKLAIIRQYPPGIRTWCYVNPANPAQAAIERGFTGNMLFGLIPLTFVIFGLGIAILVPLAIRRSRMRASTLDKADGIPRQPQERRSGPVTLKASNSPWIGFIFITIFTLIWDGVIGGIVATQFTGSKTALLSCSGLFMVPFILVGLALPIGVIYAGLSLLNPRPVITVNAASVPLGGLLELKWQFTGRADRIEKLTLELHGREEATYSRGTDTVTDKNVFLKLPIFETSRRYDIPSGRARVKIPAESMHSFDARRNKIVWFIDVHGDIPNWPDVKAEFPIVVVPLKTEVFAHADAQTAA